MNKLLGTIRGPQDLKGRSLAELRQIAEEIRQRVIEVVSRNGGHLSSNLGVVELTLALHRCLDMPTDRLVFDVGHQCYPHKLLTGRNERFETLRQAGGISGFPSPSESEYDLFHVGHAGTAIATALGLAKADEMLGHDSRTVAFVGDASIANGLAFEGLNQLNMLNRQFMVVLNDNSMGIAPTQGNLADYFTRFRVSQAYEISKRRAKRMLDNLPLVGKPMFNALEHIRQTLKAALVPTQIWEPMGLLYVGPVDGHNLGHLIELLDVLKDVEHPVLLHVHTNKGQGCTWAEAEPTAFHSPSPFNITPTGEVQPCDSDGRTFTDAFADALIEQGRRDERVVALTAAMPDGTGLKKFSDEFPDRCLDVGLAESATLDVAAGMCKAGLRPVVAIYSTFMQRSFDQIFQELSLQGLPVVLAMDRAGLVGGDGAVHHGFADIAFLRVLPRMVLAAPADEPEMQAALQFALACERPVALRYPRDRVGNPLVDETAPFELGRAVRLRDGDDVTILAYGAPAAAALQAARLLVPRGVEATVYNARFAQPLDDEMLRTAFGPGKAVLTVEDHSVAGGFGSAVLERAGELGLAVDIQQFRRLGIPADRYVPQGSRSWQLRQVGIDAEGIAAAALEVVGVETVAKRRTNGAITQPAS